MKNIAAPTIRAKNSHLTKNGKTAEGNPAENQQEIIT
jgi:hypothetical protein